MSRILSYLLILIFVVVSFSACVSEQDKEDMRKMLKDSYSNSSNSSTDSKNESSNTSNSISQSSVSSSKAENSGSTKIDNKPPQSKGDGITIHIPQSDLDELSQVASELAEYSWPEYSYESRDDIKFNPSDDWKTPYEGGTGKSYEWESD